MKVSLHYQKLNNIEVKQENEKCLQDKPPKNYENNCYRYGMKEHWSCTCRTPKHLVDLYQISIKRKEVEMNFIDSDGQVDLTHLDVSDFFENLIGAKICALMTYILYDLCTKGHSNHPT